MPEFDFAVIGGTGLTRIAGLEVLSSQTVETPWGPPSAAVQSLALGARRIGFLARHGDPHRIAPHRVNYRANLWALHALGVRRVLAINAVGGIREDMGPQTLVVPDQLIDYTYGRASSFSDAEDTAVEHVDFTSPYAGALRAALVEALQDLGLESVCEGCMAVTQGPRLETAAEIRRLRQDGCDLVGMTGMPEAVLARELGLDYACLAVVANWAAGCSDEGEISIEDIHMHLQRAMRALPALLEATLARLDGGPGG